MTTSPDPLFPISLDEYREAIDKAGTQVKAARSRLRNTTEVLRDRVTRAVAAGISENEAAKLAGVERQTVRKWLGK